MGILKTATGIFSGSVAVDAFKAEQQAGCLQHKLLLKAAGSLAAATSVHLLKDEMLEIAEELGQTRRKIVLVKKTFPD
jgi:hypothetical protein